MADLIVRDVNGNTLLRSTLDNVEPYHPPQTGMAGDVHTTDQGDYVVVLYQDVDFTD